MCYQAIQNKTVMSIEESDYTEIATQYMLWIGSFIIILYSNPLLAFPSIAYLIWINPKKLILSFPILLGLMLHDNVPQTNRFSTSRIRSLSKNCWVYEGIYHEDRKTLFFKGERPKTHFDLLIKEDNQKRPSLITAIAPYNLSEIRYKITTYIARFFRKHYSPAVASFFCSFLLGEKIDPLISNAFYKLGISHILAISGFHFGLIASLIFFILRPFFLYRVTVVFVLIAITFYMLLLGTSPSIMRSHLMISLYLLSRLLGRNTDIRYILALCAIISLSLNPKSLFDVRFPLSFGSCFGLLYFHQPITNFLSKIFLAPKKESTKLGKYFINAMACFLAVHAVIAPVLLFYFKSLNLWGIFYNIFYPPLCMISVILIPLIPICDLFTKTILNMAIYAPHHGICYLDIPHMDWLLAFYVPICHALTAYRKNQSS